VTTYILVSVCYRSAAACLWWRHSR